MNKKNPEDGPYFDVLGLSVRGAEWRRFIAKFPEQPLREKFPKGFGGFSFPKSGIHIYCHHSIVDSVALYGDESDACSAGFLAYSGGLPAGLRFGQRYDEILAQLGKPILERRLRPAVPLDAACSDQEFRQKMSAQRALPMTIRLVSYRLDDYAVTLEFDQARGDSLCSIQLLTYETLKRVHDLPDGQ